MNPKFSRSIFTQFGRISTILVILSLLLSLVGVSTAKAASVNLTATEDTYLSANDVTYNNGGNTSIHVDNTTGTSRRTALLKWDLSSIPSSATITSASITVNVTDASTLVFNLYNMRRSWVEGTSSQAASSTSANWNTYDGSNSWGTVGAASTTTDRYDTNLWGAGTTSFSSTGSKTVDLNSDGVAVVQGWINGSANYGLIMQNYSGSTANAVFFASSEATTAANRPMLNVTYSTGTTPTITTSGTLSAFSSTPGTPSAAQTYTVSGSNLTANIVITPPTGFELSTNGSTYSSSLTLTQSGGMVASTTIYVRLIGTAGTFSGNIAHTSTGATTLNVVVSGTVATGGTTRVAFGSDMHESTTKLTNLMNNILNDGFTPGVVALEGDFNNNGSAGTAYNSSVIDAAITGIFSTEPVKRYITGNNDASSLMTDGNFAYATGEMYRDSNIIMYGMHEDDFPSSLFSSNAYATAVATTDALRTYLTGLSAADKAKTIFILSHIPLHVARGDNPGGYYMANMLNDVINGDMDVVYLVGHNHTDDCSDVLVQRGTSGNFNNNGTSTSLTIEFTYMNTGYINGTESNSSCIDQGSVATVTASTITLQRYLTAADSGTVGDPIIVTRLVSDTPTITTSGTLSAFSTTPGTPSTAQTYTVSGAHLTANISISPPTGFELSTDGSTYSSSQTLTQSGGTVASTTIYVRLTGTEGTFSGNISHTSTGATTKTVAVSGVASNCSTVNLTPSGDTYLSANDPTFNNGSYNQLHVNGMTDTNRRTTLIKWDLSSIPTSVTVSSASLSLYVEDASPLVFNLYNMRRSWVEGTGSRTASTTSANWNTYDGSNSWGTVGAASTTADRYDTNLWGADTTSFSSTGSKTLDLNTDGLAVVQSWIAGSTSNYGLIIQNYSGTTNNAVFFTSTNGTTVANRPKLNVTYCASTTTPTITTTGTLSAFSSTTGTPSTAQTYTVSGSNLTANIVITPPTGFELSTNGSTYSSSLTLTQSGGTVASTTIYVRLSSASEGTFSGNITHTSTGATTRNVAVSGTVLYVYTLTVGNDGHGTVTLEPTGGSYNNGSTVTLTPVPNSGYAFSIWSGTNAADPSDNGNGTWSLIMNGNKSLTANFALSTANVAPNQPVLVQPADSATGVSASPTLQVTASDPNASDTLSVSFYGRADGTTAGADFTLVAIPDAQNYATSYPTIYTNHLKWIADNKTASNIAFATAVGDLVNTSSSSTEYTNADTAYDTLDNGSVSYSVSPGNHDMMGGTLWATYFGTSRFSGKSYYGGSNDNYNNYYLFSASGIDFILINLQYSPTTAQINWANTLLGTTYPSRRGIVVQHDILNTDNSWNNQTSYNTLRSNANLFLMLCGHMHTATDGAAYVAGTGTDGHTIHIVMQDYQDYTNGGNGYLRIYRFSPADDMIYMTTYSPTSGNSITTSPDQMNLIYDMPGSAAAYTLIGTVTGVTNGNNASISWPGRAASTEYEWYATVSDGSLTTTGPTWSFTTGAAALPGSFNKTLPTNAATGVALAPTLSWGSSSNATSYEYCFDTTNDSACSTWTSTGTTTSATLSGLNGSTTYYWQVRANNASGTTYADTSTYWSFTTVASNTQSIPLVVGWNLVSFNRQPTSTAIADVLSTVSGNFDLVYAWDATGASSSAGNWLKYDPSQPLALSSLKTLNESQGFWIHMTAADTLVITGTAPTTTNISLLTTASGWNLVGYPASGILALPGALTNHGVTAGDFSLVYAYHASEADQWKLYDPAQPLVLNDLKQMESVWGYWIKISVAHTWHVEY